MTDFSIRELGPSTWPDFARLVEKHNGVWGGCWCISFHLKSRGSNRTAAMNKADKERLVRADHAHAALVYDGADIAGWCQFGSPVELPARMSGFNELGVPPPDWRITCFFVDRDRRKEGVAWVALEGALRMIAGRGGGTVDGYPVDTRGEATSNSFLWSGTLTMFQDLGFRQLGALGPSKRIVRKVVRASRGRPTRPRYMRTPRDRAIARRS